MEGGDDMAMTTDDPKPFRVNLRINEEMNNKLILITKQTGMTVAEYVRGLISGHLVTVKQIDSSKSFGSLPEELYNDLMSMLKVSKMTYEQFMVCIDALMYDGMIMVENGKVVTSDSNIDTSCFITKCDEYGIKDYQGVFDKIVKTMKVN